MIDVPGVSEVSAWFGGWPTFHDAEILSFHINRGTTSEMRVVTWNTGAALDDEGRFVKERERVVVFELGGIKWIRLDGEDADVQNVISGLVVAANEGGGFRLDLGPCYGLSGEIIARELAVRLE